MMSNKADYIPTNDGKFLAWVKFLFAYLYGHAPMWNIPPDSWAAIDPLLAAYEAAYTKAEDPNRGKADVKAKDEARDALKAATRQYVKEYLINNHLISDEDRMHMGLPVHDTKPSPVPDPNTLVELQILFPAPGEIEIHYKDATTEGHAKPFGVHGVEICWVISDTPITHWKDLTHSTFSTHTPAVLKFDEGRGQTLWYAARWENTRGVKGPWSEIQSAIIP